MENRTQDRAGRSVLIPASSIHARRSDRDLRRKFCRYLCLAGLVWAMVVSSSDAKEKRPRSEIHVEGLSWWQNREQRLALERLLGDERGENVETNAIEDAAVILLSSLAQDGYLQASLEIETISPEGVRRTSVLKSDMETGLPRDLVAKSVNFRVHRGVRFFLNGLQLEGLSAVKPKDAEAFFRAESTFALFGRPTAYSPQRLNRSADNLREELRRRGYSEATVRAQAIRIDENRGPVDVRVEVTEGSVWRVTSLTYDISNEVPPPPGLPTGSGRSVWSRFWEQDTSASIRRAFYGRGYPDAKVQLAATPASPEGETRAVAVVARITPGPLVRVGKIRFEGNQMTRETILRRRVRLASGDLLDPLALERSRYRLSRLGVFRSVDLRYDPPGGTTRDPVFLLKETRPWEANVLFGYGSYEQARAGVELRQFNLFGRAHESRLEFVQSMKSSRGEYSYTVPELFGESIDGTARVFGLMRQERSFLRQEYGGSLMLKRTLDFLAAEATVGYTFQALRNQRSELSSSTTDNKQLNSASVDTTITSDRRDNPLRPRHGYRWLTRFETASPNFGGQADYQRAELGFSYHTAWGRGRWVHAGLMHGVVATWGSSDLLLPVNERFYPGGENSIRGYQSGEAAPRGDDGRFIGAKSYTTLNLELEQALTLKWSAIAFGDALGTAAKLANYPFNEKLYSIGLGVRYQTLIGPIRLEYGRNVNPRPGDPVGTLHISIGFPF